MVEQQVGGTPPPTEEPLLSVEELDGLLNEEAPEFDAELKAIQADISSKSVEIFEGTGHETVSGITFSWNPRELLPELLLWWAKHTSKQKKLLALFVVSCLGVIAYFWQIHRQPLLQQKDRLFVQSLAELGGVPEGFDTKDVEAFYDSPRFAHYIFQLKKVLVNLKTDSESGQLPMVMIEFLLEGDSAEALIEVKQKESEIHEAAQKFLAEKTYSELASVAGKKELSHDLSQELNQKLINGRINRIFIKNIVLKN